MSSGPNSSPRPRKSGPLSALWWMLLGLAVNAAGIGLYGWVEGMRPLYVVVGGTASPGPAGTLTASTDATDGWCDEPGSWTSCRVPKGAAVTFTATPAFGFQLSSWTVDCFPHEYNPYVATASNIDGTITCTAAFELDPRIREYLLRLFRRDLVEVTWIAPPSPELVPVPATAPPRAAPRPNPPPPPPEPKRPPPPPAVVPPKVAEVRPEPPKPEPKKPEPPKPPEEKAQTPKVALIPQPKPPEATPPPAPPPPPPKPLQIERHKAVEVDDDEHVVSEPPPEAAFLSDKNRRVQEETRDTRSNLEKQSKGKASASEKSDDSASEEIGGADEQVHQLEKSIASSLEKREAPPTAHNGQKDEAKGVLSGSKGEAGRGDGGSSGQGGKPGALAMRNVQGRGAPGGLPAPSIAPSGANDDAPAVAQSPTPGDGGGPGREGRAGKAGKPGARGPKTQLTMSDYERIAGADKLNDEAALAQRQSSHKKGRWEKKLEQIHASLENFTPAVKPGNQNALGTRAAPFAVFIARMHRRIHELWGFGFLEDLDGKSSGNPMNDRKLLVTLEIVLNADGTLDRATIVRPSGILTFDVAAIDTVQSAAPFEAPPEAIRSGNGKIYLHWTFHRDERQCATDFAQPFILDNAGSDGKEHGLPDPTAGRERRHAETISRTGSPTEGGVSVPHATRTADAEAAAARATVQSAAPDDPAAVAAALAWADAFEGGRIDALLALSEAPFSSSGSVVATDAAGMQKVWANLLDETPHHDIKEWKLFTAGGYRAVFGHLPKGGEDGTNRLYLAVRLGREWLTLDVLPGTDGKYRVRGLTR